MGRHTCMHVQGMLSTHSRTRTFNFVTISWLYDTVTAVHSKLLFIHSRLWTTVHLKW
jgi:hypothetical protein